MTQVTTQITEEKINDMVDHMGKLANKGDFKIEILNHT